MIVSLKNNCQLRYPNELKSEKENLIKLVNWVIRTINLNGAILSFIFYYDESEDFGGVCTPHYSKKNAYDILLNIHHINDKEFPKMLLHELTHAKQMQLGDLIIKRKADGLTWKGTFYNKKDFEEYSERKHRFLPWEIPAYKSEKAQIPLYVKKMKIIALVHKIFRESTKIKPEDLCLLP